MDALTPQPAPGQTEDLKSLYRPEVWRELGAFCCLGSGFSVNCTCGWHFIYWKGLHGTVLSARPHLYSLHVHSLDKYESRKLVVCIIRACSTRECFFSSTFPTSPPPHSSYAWFLTWLRPHKNAIHWISYPWMVWFGSQSVSSPCPRESCSVLVPAVYLWAGLGPALLIIHETFDGPEKKSTPCWILIPTNDLGKKISNFSARFQNENRWEQ